MTTPTPHRIALIGPGGSGKSTLATALAERLGLPLIEETFRNAKRLVAQYDTTDETRPRLEQQIGLMHQVAAESKHVATGFVSDRSIYDYMIYSDLRGCTWPADGPQPLLAEARRWWREVGGYTLVVYVPPFSDAPPEDDGFRFVDPEFVTKERRAFDKLARFAGWPTLTWLWADGVEARSDEAAEAIADECRHQRLTRIQRHEGVMAAVAAARKAMR